MIKEAYSIAVSNLRSCYGSQGILAGLNHFKDYWARDSSFASFGALRLGDHEIVKKNLLMFIYHMRPNGQIPLRIGKSSLDIVLSYFGLKSKDSPRMPILRIDKSNDPSTDQNSLLIIAALEYYKFTKDKFFILDNLKKFDKIIGWNFSRSKDGLLIEEKGYCNWADSINKKGKVLFTNICHCHALECISEINKIAGRAEMSSHYFELHEKVKKQINHEFWSGEHYIDWIDKDKHYNYFSTDGNILAIIWGIADSKRSKLIEEAAFIFDINEVPSACVHPKYPSNLISSDLKLMGLADYHNGLSWIWLGCMTALAKHKLGMKKEGKELMETISEMIVKYNGVYEVYENTGKPVNRFIYKSEMPLAWSAGLFVYAAREMNLIPFSKGKDY
ncbi:MAG: GH116 family glycosyl hydrolase [archaeon]